MTAEEFHSALQEATNFPLRAFVLPYLKHTLPSLQRDLSNAARASNQVKSICAFIRYAVVRSPPPCVPRHGKERPYGEIRWNVMRTG